MTRRTLSLLFALPMMACGDKDTDEPVDSEVEADADTDADTDTDADADSDTDADTDVPCEEEVSATGVESVFTATTPTLDGDFADWGCLPAVQVTANANLVYTPEGAAEEPSYPGYTSTTVTMYSMYTDTDVYFLVQWDDATHDIARFPWEKQADGGWAQLSNKDNSGHESTFYEDKVAIQWAIDSAAFESAGCMASCHISGDNANPGKKYNKNNQVTDMWHWKSVRTNPNSQLDDKLVSYIESALCSGENCRVADTKTAGGYKDNTFGKYGSGCTADPDGTLGLPCFMGPTGSELANADTMWIFDDEKQGFVDSFSTGDQVPGMVTASFEGSRGDVAAYGAWADGVWTLEIQRSLTTSSGEAEDVQFDDLDATYYFGLASFDNTQINHAAHAGVLTLAFRPQE